MAYCADTSANLLKDEKGSLSFSSLSLDLQRWWGWWGKSYGEGCKVGRFVFPCFAFQKLLLYLFRTEVTVALRNREERNKKRERERKTLTSFWSEGETGGLSESELPLWPPLRGPLLWERRPEVRGDTSCCDRKKKLQKMRVIIQSLNGNCLFSSWDNKPILIFKWVLLIL